MIGGMKTKTAIRADRLNLWSPVPGSTCVRPPGPFRHFGLKRPPVKDTGPSPSRLDGTCLLLNYHFARYAYSHLIYYSDSMTGL